MAFVRSHGKLVARCIGVFVLLGGCISSAVVLGVKRDALPAMLRWVHEHRVGGMFIYGLIYICESVCVLCVCVHRGEEGAEVAQGRTALRAVISARTHALFAVPYTHTHAHTHPSHCTPACPKSKKQGFTGELCFLPAATATLLVRRTHTTTPPKTHTNNPPPKKKCCCCRRRRSPSAPAPSLASP